MATLHIRNVPEEVVEVLKDRASANGRSLNGEVVSTLAASARKPSIDVVLESISALAATIPNPPSGDEIVEGIREGREERTDRILRAAGPVPHGVSDRA